MYAGLRVISGYIREHRFKSRVWKIMHVFRDDLGNIKGTKMVHGNQRVCRGIGVVPKVEPRLWDSSLRKSCLKMYTSNEIKLKT